MKNRSTRFQRLLLDVCYLAVVLQEDCQLRLSLVQLTDVLDGVG